MLKTQIRKIGLGVAASALAVGVAFAAVTFQSVSVSVNNTNGDLDVAFTATGLASGTDAAFTGNAPYQATWGCVSQSSKLVKPSISNQYIDSGTDNVTVHLTVDKRGRAIGTVVLSPSDVTSTCTGNKTWQLVKVAWGKVTLSGYGATWTGNGATWNQYGL